MGSNLDKYQEALTKLIAAGDDMLMDIMLQVDKRDGRFTSKDTALYKTVKGIFSQNYQHWYTEAHAVVFQLIPNRLTEFEVLYKGDGRRKSIETTTYNIQDWLMGMRAAEDKYTGEKRFEDLGTVVMRFQTQLAILKSANVRFKSALVEIKQLLQADLFDTELDASRELLRNGFARAAGAVAGVVLEEHLLQVCSNHAVVVKKKDSSINDYNDLLKGANVIEIPQWRFIQRLGDLRNLCDHKKAKDPTKDEIDELISGVDRVIKTLS